MTEPHAKPGEPGRSRLPWLALGALGVVFGDLGTSPLYALQEAFTIWREKLFSVMIRNATPASAFFGLTPNRVVELGRQIEI